jgi:hypothetical protein
MRRDVDRASVPGDRALDRAVDLVAVGPVERSTMRARTSACAPLVASECKRGWPIDRLRSTRRRLVVDATSGAARARASAFAITSAPGS